MSTTKSSDPVEPVVESKSTAGSTTTVFGALLGTAAIVPN
jgi:hypothetical protein